MKRKAEEKNSAGEKAKARDTERERKNKRQIRGRER